ncbi:hypothetical protein H5411_34330 [Amycolatopsis echigonensis]|uniref:Uncharacterized protein n=1 Tax=Amycolatopsis echigonensis TaxID=2576905 RepID=A0A8E1W544_9PSEU|nr:hypothetical protein [Amycolatopsis echigonensis]
MSIADAERLVATTPYLKTFRLLWTTYDGGVLMFLLAQAGGMLLLAAANLSFTRQLAGLLARVRLRDQPVGRVRRWLMNGYTVRGGTLWAHLLVAGIAFVLCTPLLITLLDHSPALNVLLSSDNVETRSA